MNISELEDSEAMSKVISSRRGEIKEKLLELKIEK